MMGNVNISYVADMSPAGDPEKLHLLCTCSLLGEMFTMYSEVEVTLHALLIHRFTDSCPVKAANEDVSGPCGYAT